MNQNTEENTPFLPFARPQIGPEEEEAVLRVMRSGWLTTGQETLAFEAEFADYLGSPHALAVNSATSGLHLALEALGIGPGDTVITSPYTFTSSAAVIRHQGAEVAFCDTAPGSYNIDPAALAQILASTKNCRAIIVVHVGGLPCQMDPILELAKTYGCAVIEDAAHAFPVRSGTAFAGTRGDIGVYSFYATKTITTGEGGMVVTANPKLVERIGLMRMHGIDRAVWDRYTAPKAAWRYSVSEAGFKYNLPDILSAIGRVQLRRANQFADQRRAIARQYNQVFRKLPGLALPPGAELTDGQEHAWHLYSLRAGLNGLGPSRDQLIDGLRRAGIGTSVHFIPLHLMPYYSTRYGLEPEDFPNALTMFEHSLSLPIWQGMSTAEVERVTAAVSGLAGRR